MPGEFIWATGYSLDFGWVGLPIFDGRGEPIHRRGVTAAPGIYFLGLRWLHTAKSQFSMTNSALSSGDRSTMLSLASDFDTANNLGCPLN